MSPLFPPDSQDLDFHLVFFDQHQSFGSMNFQGPNSSRASTTRSWLTPIPAAILLLYFSITCMTACSFRFMSASAPIGSRNEL